MKFPVQSCAAARTAAQLRRCASPAKSMRAFELKIPPPVLALGLAFLMWWSSSFVASLNVPLAYRVGIALVIGAIGTGIDVAAKIAFSRCNTTVNPVRPNAASVLVSGGLYRFTRNPMYLGRSLQLVAWAIYLCNGVAPMLVLFFVVYLTRFQILPEERALTARFGDAYITYQLQVPRWV
jgi:protein-S-isoprenylcysteine O-methyltransferase Ste14